VAARDNVTTDIVLQRVLTVVYNARNNRVSGLRPSAEILNTRIQRNWGGGARGDEAVETHYATAGSNRDLNPVS
jgi:hypothetical protein